MDTGLEPDRGQTFAGHHRYRGAVDEHILRPGVGITGQR
jgi:hypothetical protein